MEGMTVELREFLTARLAEDEATARAAADFGADWRFADDIFPSDDSRHPGSIIAGSYGCGIPDQYGNHVVRHDPARVLRDVEATRRQLADLLPEIEQMAAVIQGEYGPSPTLVGAGLADRLLRQTAARWSDHPDYDPSWTPGGGNAVG